MRMETYNALKTRTLFWDIDLLKLDKDLHKDFILYRIMEEGNMKDVKWMMQFYTRDEITNFIINSNRLSKKTASFWKNILDINTTIKCLSMPYQTIQKKFWNN